MRVFVLLIALVQLTVVGTGRVTTLYTIKKFDFQFSSEFFNDITAFYLPVRGKWGRIHLNLTVAKKITEFWMDLKTFRLDDCQAFQILPPRFSVNICDLTNQADNNVLFKFIPGVRKHFKNFIDSCPIEQGTQLIVSDRTLKQIPRQGPGPIIPSGLFKFFFSLRTDQNLSLGFIDVRFQFRGF